MPAQHNTPMPMTPDMLADRWHCSAETVRNLVKSGDLRGFRVGRMIRIPWDAVEEYECQGSQSDDCAAGSASTGQTRTPESGGAISLRHARERRPKRKAATDT
ncbi:helix-turn-helix domain-containing protein [Roseovarius pacificus]|uniref:helix-turn-helix domain-containing protein n=1 Tax=Roseovarius pacificus TaxID=337701 RepID=UPI0040396009